MTPVERRKVAGKIQTVLDLVPRSKMDALINAIAGDATTASSVNREAGLTAGAADGVAFLLDDNTVQREAILLALEAARVAKTRALEGREEIEMSWTGPIQFSGGDRGHPSILADMITRASRTVTVVGYSITSGADGVIRLLEKAVARGVVVTIVVHDDEGRANIDALRRTWKNHRRPRLFTRDARTEGGYYKIHAKMVVTDLPEMLVTSANLTWHGMNKNLEIGLRVRGQTARKGQALVDDLIARRYLEEIHW